MEYKSSDSFLKPNVCECMNEGDVHYNKKPFNPEYFTLEAINDCIFTISINSGVTTNEVQDISYSTDNGETWTTTPNVSGQVVTITTPQIAAGNKVLVKGNANALARTTGTTSTSTTGATGATQIGSTGEFNVRGNIMSLLYNDDFADKETLPNAPYSFTRLFYANPNIISAENLFLPASETTVDCYNRMFSACVNLIAPPKILYATKVSENGYSGMFYGCTKLEKAPEFNTAHMATNACAYMFYSCRSLTTAPELPATTLEKNCYESMFEGCSELVVPPSILPAEELAEYCYKNMFCLCVKLVKAPRIAALKMAKYSCYCMFIGCTSLTTAHDLLATELETACYQQMFNSCTSLTTAPKLPATTMAVSAYTHMFVGCTSLTTAPELPAATIAAGFCYYGMFEGCTSLTVAPELPATTLADWCYYGMFEGCTSLTTAPQLPATTLANYCYQAMFKNCTGLTTAPSILPATTLANNCYGSFANSTQHYGMFDGCINLLNAPELPATTLVSGCYSAMFYNCKKINRIKAMFTTTPSATYMNNWVTGVSNTGTFIKNSAATWNNTFGASAIPKSTTYKWTVETATE